MNRLKGNKNLLICSISVITLMFLAILTIYVKTKLDNEKNIQVQDVGIFNDNNKSLALLSKTRGSSTFSEITSTPTSGNWTIKTNCKGMNVTWNNSAYSLKVLLTQIPASCEIYFIEV